MSGAAEISSAPAASWSMIPKAIRPVDCSGRLTQAHRRHSRAPISGAFEHWRRMVMVGGRRPAGADSAPTALQSVGLTDWLTCLTDSHQRARTISASIRGTNVRSGQHTCRDEMTPCPSSARRSITRQRSRCLQTLLPQCVRVARHTIGPAIMHSQS